MEGREAPNIAAGKKVVGGWKKLQAWGLLCANTGYPGPPSALPAHITFEKCSQD